MRCACGKPATIKFKVGGADATEVCNACFKVRGYTGKRKGYSTPAFDPHLRSELAAYREIVARCAAQRKTLGLAAWDSTPPEMVETEQALAA